MLEARSIAVLGASERAGSFGLRLAQSVLSAGYAGRIDFVNPRQSEILGRPCYRSIGELGEAPDLAILGVGVANLESALLAAIDRGARSAVVFDACHGDTAAGTPLLPRLRDIAREAGLPVCGGAGMGFIDVPAGCVASFYPAAHLKPGGISLIAHSGSVFTVLAMNDPRYRFDLIVSPGQEIGATVDEYIDYAVARPNTSVVAVFMEAARNPQGFVASLRRARDAGVPVVVCKVGRSEESARMAQSHTGALAGSNAAYEAAIAACGAISVATVDELMNVALLCAGGRRPGPGGVGLVTDSGGLRELAMDCAADLQAPLARLSPETLDALRAALPPSLQPSNPLDCAAELTDDFAKVFERGLSVLAAAPEVSMIGLEADLRDDYVYLDALQDLALALPQITAKPCFFYSSFARANNRVLGETLAEQGVPCFNGVAAMLQAVKHVQAWSDRARAGAGKEASRPQRADTRVSEWRRALMDPAHPGERETLELLARFDIPVIRSESAENLADAIAAAERIGYPIAMKTATKGIAHKSDQDGVRLNLADRAMLQAAYEDLSGRLGAWVIVQGMAAKGIELAMGCVHDADFGPLVMVSAGGTLIEVLADRQFALAPFDESTALAMIESLAVAKILKGVRGAPAADVRAAARALARFSELCAELDDKAAEIDVNPLIVSATGAVAVDALLISAPMD
jgi:acetyltransferase